MGEPESPLSAAPTGELTSSAPLVSHRTARQAPPRNAKQAETTIRRYSRASRGHDNAGINETAEGHENAKNDVEQHRCDIPPRAALPVLAKRTCVGRHIFLSPCTNRGRRAFKTNDIVADGYLVDRRTNFDQTNDIEFTNLTGGKHRHGQHSAHANLQPRGKPKPNLQNDHCAGKNFKNRSRFRFEQESNQPQTMSRSTGGPGIRKWGPSQKDQKKILSQSTKQFICTGLWSTLRDDEKQ